MKYFVKTKQTLSFLFLIILGLSAISCNAEAQGRTTKSFPEFWKEFRIASLNNDIVHLVEMTRFPFILKGDLDMDGSVVLDKANFKKRFKSFMEQDTREDLKPDSMRDYIKKNESISPRIDDGQTNVGLFSFELIEGKWYFVRVYVEEI